jgi:hypothetical protein
MMPLRKLEFSNYASDWDDKTEAYWYEDSQRIQTLLQEHGYDLTLSECCDLWEKRSNEYDAGWLILPKEKDDLLKDLLKYSEK